MTLPQRPHDAPCACTECAEWARAIVAIPVETRKLAPVPSVVAPEMPLADFMRGIVEMACKATGMTEEQLRARGAELQYEPPPRPVRCDRETAAARGIPEIHLAAVYDHEPVECDALTAVRMFVGSGHVILVLSGGVGLRKTGSACWLLTRKAGRFVKADELMRLAGSRDPEDVTLWRQTRGTQVLVIDDLGGEYVDDKGWAVKVVNALVDYRYEHRLKTVITTNLEAPKFRATYGERVADRIRESGRWLTLGGQSVRRRA